MRTQHQEISERVCSASAPIGTGDEPGPTSNVAFLHSLSVARTGLSRQFHTPAFRVRRWGWNDQGAFLSDHPSFKHRSANTQLAPKSSTQIQFVDGLGRKQKQPVGIRTVTPCRPPVCPPRPVPGSDPCPQSPIIMMYHLNGFPAVSCIMSIPSGGGGRGHP